MKKILTTPIKAEDLQDIRVGDVIYLTGTLVTCRDVCHRRLIELKRPIPYDLNGKAIFHAGPIVRKNGDKWEMVSVGPTTSMRMESFEREFIEQTGVKLVVGKGGMGPLTEEGCQKFKALHVIFPAGCAVLAYSAAIFLIPICISFDTAEKHRYATYLILNRRFSFEF